MWIIVRIFYYENDKTPLLLLAVRPLLRALKEDGLIEKGYFSRHWHRGPHIRLYLQTSAEHMEGIQAKVKEKIGAFLASTPSRRVITEEAVRARHEQLAAHEYISGPLFPLLPDNSIDYARDESNDFMYGGATGFELARDFYSHCQPLVFDVIERGRSERSMLLSQAFSWMLITANWLENLRISYISYRSHAEGFLYGFDHKGTLRLHLKQQYKNQAETLIAMVKPHLDAYYTGGNDLDIRWRESIEMYGKPIGAAIDAGNIRLPLFNEPDQDGMSLFHQASYNQPWMQEFTRSNLFHKRRFILNILYEILLQIGITPLEKIYLCFALANAVEEATGTPWQMLLKDRASFILQYSRSGGAGRKGVH